MSKSNLFNPKKHTPKNRKKLIGELSEFYHLELWDRQLMETLLALPIEDDELGDLINILYDEKESAWYEGYEEAREKMRKAIYSTDIEDTGHYDTRKAVLELDEN